MRAGVADEIPHNQEVAGEAHLLEHVDFRGEALLIRGEGLALAAFLGGALEQRDALEETFANNFFEITVQGVAFRDAEFGEGIGDPLDPQVAAAGDLHGARESLRKIRKHGGHLFGSLEIKLVGGEPHAVLVAHGLAGLDAQQNFLSASVGVG